MRSIITVLMTLAFALSVVGCAGFKTSLDDQEIKATKRIAVVSNLGDKAYSGAVSVMAFGNHLSGRPVPDWNIDQFVSAATVTALTTVGYERVEVLSLPSTMQGLSRYEYNQRALSEAARQGFDTVVVASQSSFPGLPFFLPGYGVFRYTGHEDRVEGKCHYVAYSITVYRAATNELLASPRSTSDGPCFSSPGRVLDDAAIQAKRTIHDYSPSEMKSMREGVVKEIERTLAPALREAGLIR